MPRPIVPILAALAYTACAAMALAPDLTPAPAPAPREDARHTPTPTPALLPVLDPVTPRPTVVAPAAVTPGATLEPSATLQPPTLPEGAFAFVAAFADQCTVLLDQVPALPQERNMSCEAAATRMVLAGRGLVLREEAILERMGLDPNPHLGFRGNVDGEFHREDLADYGTYAEVVARVIESYGAPAGVVYGMGDDELRAAVAGGSAVIVWMTRQPEPRIIEAEGYRLVDGEHVQVVVGLGAEGQFLVHDPWGARPDSGRAGTELVPEILHWDLFDRMAVVVPL